MWAAEDHDAGAASTPVDTRQGWAWRDVIALHRQRHSTPRGPRRRCAILLGGPTDPALVRAAQRLTGEPVPTPFCRLGPGAPTLLELALRRVAAHVDAAATHVVMDGRQRRWAEPHAGRIPGRVRWSQFDNGSAVSVIAALVPALVRDPEATVVVMPVNQSVAVEGSFAITLDRAFRAAAVSRDLVSLGAEPSDAIGEHDWLVPFAPPWLSGAGTIPSTRLVVSPPPETVAQLRHAGALVHTGVVVGQGRAFLELFEDLTPRLLRLFLYGAAMPAPRAETFLAQAQEGLGELDLSRDLLGLAPVLRAAVVPAGAGWIDLRSPTRMAAWLARERNARLLNAAPATTYRRRQVPGVPI